MIFNYESAMREARRMNENGGDGDYTIKKVWYGWIVIDRTERGRGA
ncbi:hypothetical protein [Pseudomonas frederiksbergensis]|nr:hypothetical protein [Pseudomonas frederiksbergensis]